MKQLLFCIILLTSCTNTVLIKDLKLKNNKYYHGESSSPFTGIAKGYYDSGELSAENKYKKGIPLGKWVGYAYNGEIIGQGFRTVIKFSEKKTYLSNVVRINLDKWYEVESMPFISIYFVTALPNSEILNYKNEITEMLRKDKFINQTDTLFTISVGRGELEDSDK